MNEMDGWLYATQYDEVSDGWLYATQYDEIDVDGWNNIGFVEIEKERRAKILLEIAAHQWGCAGLPTTNKKTAR